MTTTSFGAGILPGTMPTVDSDVTPVPMPVMESPTDTPPVEMPTIGEPELEIPKGSTLSAIIDAVKAGLRHEMDAAVADAERRLAQARELERSALYGEARQVHTEDLNINKHLIDGYTLTANSPAAGSIAWASLHVVFMGVDYTIADGNTANKYAWFVKPASGTTATLQSGNTLPTLGANDALIFVNNSGTPVSALETSISYAVGPGVIGNEQLATSVQQVLSTLQANDIAQQSALDGAITTYYQNDAPWPAGSPSPSGGNVNMGDVWYDSNDGGAFRWTGATPGTGVTANTWQRIADTDTSALAGKVNTKTTTYLASTAVPPVAPSGGFTIGDLWMKTDQNNLLARWDGSAWINLQLGDAAISGIGGSKVGSGISASNVTTGTLAGTLVGTGVNATNVTTGTLAGARVGTGVAPSVLTGAGTAPVAAIPQLTPAKLNTAFHMLY